MKPSTKKRLITGLKIVLSAAAFYFAYTKIDVNQFKSALSDTKLGYVVLATLGYVFSQVISSKRLQLILERVPVQVPFGWNLRLYFLGMAYNLFLPGGIGGDAYKVLAYANKSRMPGKKFVTALLGDRLVGLAAIILLLLLSLIFLPGPDVWWTSPLWTLFALPVVFVGYFVVKKWFNAYRSAYFKALLLSVLIQAVQMASILLIIKSIGLDVVALGWIVLFVFLLSTIATAIPVFMGGLGAREVVFGSMFPLFQLSPEQGVLIAVIFSIVVIISSLPGLLFVFSKTTEKDVT